MGNDQKCCIRGIGSVKLGLVDGTFKLLTSVRYIPELKRNLISLGTLDRAGYNYKVEAGVMKIYKGSLLKLKGILENGLYVLQGCSASSSLNTVFVNDTKSTALWHRRLGHISHRGLIELHK